MKEETKINLARAILIEYNAMLSEKLSGKVNHDQHDLDDLYYTFKCVLDNDEYKIVDPEHYEYLYMAIHDPVELCYRFSVKYR